MSSTICLPPLCVWTHQNYVHASKHPEVRETYFLLYFWCTDPLIIRIYSLRTTIFTLLSYCQYEHFHKAYHDRKNTNADKFGPCYIT